MFFRPRRLPLLSPTMLLPLSTLLLLPLGALSSRSLSYNGLATTPQLGWVRPLFAPTLARLQIELSSHLFCVRRFGSYDM
jgi:hypothetical protein